ncbi:MAG: hypothetical protein K8S20_00025 [Chloroflexi bacterium]|nr:hypothetical protein [Chloroflexota bacterium]
MPIEITYFLPQDHKKLDRFIESAEGLGQKIGNEPDDRSIKKYASYSSL